MTGKIKVGVAAVLAGALAGAVWLVLKQRSEPPVTVTLRIAVSPAEQLSFVAGRGKSAQFKYLMGKQSGVKPVLAQRLSIRPVPNSPALEAQVGVPTQEAGRRYAAAFVPTLQDLCGREVKLTLAAESVR